jgi:hypothetical protein
MFILYHDCGFRVCRKVFHSHNRQIEPGSRKTVCCMLYVAAVSNGLGDCDWLGSAPLWHSVLCIVDTCLDANTREIGSAVQCGAVQCSVR